MHGKLLDSDWLRKECKTCNTSAKKCNTSAKSVIWCKLHIEILDYDWLMNNRDWSGLIKSLAFFYLYKYHPHLLFDKGLVAFIDYQEEKKTFRLRCSSNNSSLSDLRWGGKAD